MAFLLTSQKVLGFQPGCSRSRGSLTFRPVSTHPGLGPTTHRPSLRAYAQTDEEPLTGEWPASWSLASYEDVGEYFQQNLFKDQAEPGLTLSNIMSTNLTVTTPETTISEAKKLFKEVSGIPVVKSSSDWTILGVLSKKDLSKPGKTVADVMSSPPRVLKPENKVADAACVMLKNKVHRIPLVDSSAKVVGIVTRTDIFSALGNEQASDEVKVGL